MHHRPIKKNLICVNGVMYKVFTERFASLIQAKYSSYAENVMIYTQLQVLLDRPFILYLKMPL